MESIKIKIPKNKGNLQNCIQNESDLHSSSAFIPQGVFPYYRINSESEPNPFFLVFLVVKLLKNVNGLISINFHYNSNLWDFSNLVSQSSQVKSVILNMVVIPM